jgi:hypothetical protein
LNFRHLLILAFTLVLVMNAVSYELTDKELSYDMVIELKGKNIGTSHFLLTPLENGDTQVVSSINIEIHFLMMNIKVNRDTKYIVKKDGGFSHYICQMMSNISGYTYTVEAINEEKTVSISTTKNGRTKTKYFKKGVDFDYMTGDISNEFVNMDGTKKTVRFLDLDNNALLKMSIILKDQFFKYVDGEKKLLYSLEIKSKSERRNSVVIAYNDVPLLLQMEIPVIGWVESRVTNVNISEEPGLCGDPEAISIQ